MTRKFDNGPLFHQWSSPWSMFDDSDKDGVSLRLEVCGRKWSSPKLPWGHKRSYTVFLSWSLLTMTEHSAETRRHHGGILRNCVLMFRTIYNDVQHPWRCWRPAHRKDHNQEVNYRTFDWQGYTHNLIKSVREDFGFYTFSSFFSFWGSKLVNG